MTWTTRQRSDLAGLSACIAGSGPQVLLIHGVGLRAEAWNRQVDALCGEYRTVAVDMPGHGGSAPLHGAAGLTEFTDAIAAGLSDPVLVIGHSMGAMIALDMAIRSPELVRGAVALNAVFERTPEAAAAVIARADSLDGATPPDPAPTLHRWFGEEATPERAACHDWLRATDPAAYKAAYGIFAREAGPSRSALAALTCPALFLTGSEEPNSTPQMSRAMAELTQNGRAAIIEGAAHMMPMTHAAEVNAALLAFAPEVLG